VADGRYGYEKQVPSKIAYDPRTTWGYNTERGALAYCWTKLLLDRYAEASDFDDTEIREVEGPGLMQTPPGKTPEDVVSDYLTQLYAHVMAHLAREISVALLQVTPIEFWFTMPALWSVRAENATRDAAVRAGFGSRTGDTIHLIREPEAAAIACLNDLIKNGENPLVKVCH
jgi:molecular chaperone DnaK (HSP70)